MPGELTISSGTVSTPTPVEETSSSWKDTLWAVVTVKPLRQFIANRILSSVESTISTELGAELTPKGGEAFTSLDNLGKEIDPNWKARSAFTALNEVVGATGPDRFKSTLREYLSTRGGATAFFSRPIAWVASKVVTSQMMRLSSSQIDSMKETMGEAGVNFVRTEVDARLDKAGSSAGGGLYHFVSGAINMAGGGDQWRAGVVEGVAKKGLGVALTALRTFVDDYGEIGKAKTGQVVDRMLSMGGDKVVELKPELAGFVTLLREPAARLVKKQMEVVLSNDTYRTSDNPLARSTVRPLQRLAVDKLFSALGVPPPEPLSPEPDTSVPIDTEHLVSERYGDISPPPVKITLETTTRDLLDFRGITLAQPDLTQPLEEEVRRGIESSGQPTERREKLRGFMETTTRDNLLPFGNGLVTVEDTPPSQMEGSEPARALESHDHGYGEIDDRTSGNVRSYVGLRMTDLDTEEVAFGSGRRAAVSWLTGGWIPPSTCAVSKDFLRGLDTVEMDIEGNSNRTGNVKENVLWNLHDACGGDQEQVAQVSALMNKAVLERAVITPMEGLIEPGEAPGDGQIMRVGNVRVVVEPEPQLRVVAKNQSPVTMVSLQARWKVKGFIGTGGKLQPVDSSLPSDVTCSVGISLVRGSSAPPTIGGPIVSSTLHRRVTA